MGTKQKKRNKKRSGAARFLLWLGGLAVIGAVSAYFLLHQMSGPLDINQTAAISVEIPSGTGTSGIAKILSDQELIRSESIFKVKSKMSGYEGKFKAGQYDLSASMSMTEMMDIIISGNSNTLRFTIPEGLDIKRTIAILEKQQLIDGDLFRKEIRSGNFDYRFLKDAPAGDERLEGYLFPETYDIFTSSKEHQIIDRMLAQFDQVFKDEYYDRAEELGMTINEVITLASIIEREARVSADRPIISSAFHNRLGISMPLQSCATVQYILGEQKPVLSIKDTQIESPYNTYLNKGLPPAPICSPGAESIHAALYPADTNYLYFVAKGDGSHAFSANYDQFLKDKKTYLK